MSASSLRLAVSTEIVLLFLLFFLHLLVLLLLLVLLQRETPESWSRGAPSGAPISWRFVSNTNRKWELNGGAGVLWGVSEVSRPPWRCRDQRAACSTPAWRSLLLCFCLCLNISLHPKKGRRGWSFREKKAAEEKCCVQVCRLEGCQSGRTDTFWWFYRALITPPTANIQIITDVCADVRGGNFHCSLFIKKHFSFGVFRLQWRSQKRLNIINSVGINDIDAVTLKMCAFMWTYRLKTSGYQVLSTTAGPTAPTKLHHLVQSLTSSFSEQTDYVF